MLETIKRIALSQVREAFQLANIKPKRLDSKRCIMSAMCYPEPFDYLTESYGDFDDTYVNGVMFGWDGTNPCMARKDVQNDIKFKLGYADGAAAWRIINVQFHF